MKTTMTAGRSSENCGRFAGGHFAGGHDGMANLCKPITAHDFHVRYNNTECRLASILSLDNLFFTVFLDNQRRFLHVLAIVSKHSRQFQACLQL